MTEAGQTVLGQKGTCRNRADGKSPAGFGQMENGSKRLSPFDTTLCRSQSGGQSINFDFPTWLKWYKVMAAFELLHLLPLAASTRTPLLHCKYEGHVLPFFKVVMSRILKLSCVILNQLYRMVSRKSSHEQLWLVTAYSTLWPKSLLCGRVWSSALCELRQKNQRKSTNGTAGLSHVLCACNIIYPISWNLLDTWKDRSNKLNTTGLFIASGHFDTPLNSG